MSNKELSKEESLALITEMIGQAKRNLAQGGSFYFLLWGWVVMLCNLGHYSLWRFGWYDEPHIVWVLTIPAALASVIYGYLRKQRSGLKSHLDNLYGFIWLAMFLAALTVLYFAGSATTMNGIILMFAATGTFLTGVTLRFTPSIVGAVLLWVSAVIAFSAPLMDQYLIAAVGIFAGYIVPGYMLRKAENERI